MTIEEIQDKIQMLTKYDLEEFLYSLYNYGYDDRVYDEYRDAESAVEKLLSKN